MFNANVKVIKISQLARFNFLGSLWVTQLCRVIPCIWGWVYTDAPMLTVLPVMHVFLSYNLPFIRSLEIVVGLENKASIKTLAYANGSLESLMAEIRLMSGIYIIRSVILLQLNRLNTIWFTDVAVNFISPD